MKSFAASISVRAAPERIWALLTDASGYPAWNSTVDRVEGRIAAGETIKVYAKIAPGRAFPVRVSAFEPGRRMTWTGGMPLGLFRGQREFTLTPTGDGSVVFAMQETFTGLLAPLIGWSMPDLQPAFDAFAADLKACAESGR